MTVGMLEHDDLALANNTPAWHFRGNVLEGEMDSKTAIKASGLGWLVYLEPAYGESLEREPFSLRTGGTERVPGFYHTYRIVEDPDGKKRKLRLGQVGKNYTVLQNWECFRALDEVCGEAGVKIETAGSLWNGREVFISAVFPDEIVIKDDRIKKFFVVRTTHDGTKSLIFYSTCIRPVCNNTVTLGINTAELKLYFRHTRNVSKRLEQGIARSVLTASADYWKKYGGVVSVLASKSIDEAFVGEWLREDVFPDPPGGNNAIATKRRDRVMDLFAGGQIGADMDAIKGTGWGALNALAQFLSWESPVRPRGGRDRDEAKFESDQWGNIAQKRQFGFKSLTARLGIEDAEYAEAAEVMAA